MYASADTRQMSVLLRISNDLDIVGDVSVVVDDPSELLAWCHVLRDPVIRAWRAGADGHRYVHVTDVVYRAPIHGRVTAILKGDHHRAYWDALIDQDDLEPGSDLPLRPVDLGAAWDIMPVTAPQLPEESHPRPDADQPPHAPSLVDEP